MVSGRPAQSGHIVEVLRIIKGGATTSGSCVDFAEMHDLIAAFVRNVPTLHQRAGWFLRKRAPLSESTKTG